MTPTRVAVGVYLALTLNVIFVVIAIGLSTARPAAQASDLVDALREKGYVAPYTLIYEQLNASQSSQNQLVYRLIVPSSAVLCFCVFHLHSKPEIYRGDNGDELPTRAVKK